MKYKCTFEYFARIVQITAFNKIILRKKEVDFTQYNEKHTHCNF